MAAGAALGIFAHSALDWDWQLPAVMLPALILVFGVIRAADGGTGRPTRWVPVLAVPFAALALLLAGGVLAVVDVDRGKHAASNGDLAKALTLAQVGDRPRSRRVGAAPPRGERARRPRPRTGEQRGLRRSGWLVRRDNFVIYADWASVLLARGDDRAARPLLRRALKLNPKDRRTRLLARIAGLPVTTP